MLFAHTRHVITYHTLPLGGSNVQARPGGYRGESCVPRVRISQQRRLGYGCVRDGGGAGKLPAREHGAHGVDSPPSSNNYICLYYSLRSRESVSSPTARRHATIGVPDATAHVTLMSARTTRATKQTGTRVITGTLHSARCVCARA